jgi:hypothetical protein
MKLDKIKYGVGATNQTVITNVSQFSSLWQ